MIQFPIVQYENKVSYSMKRIYIFSLILWTLKPKIIHMFQIHSVVYFEKNMNSLNESTESSTLVKFQDPEVQVRSDQKWVFAKIHLMFCCSRLNWNTYF